MKKTTTINLGQSIFHIDEDAYEQLRQYLDSLRNHFKNEEGADEILEDIEIRMSDLFKEHTRYGLEVVTIKEVDEVIGVMGHPEDFEKDGLATEPSTENSTSENTTEAKQPEKSEEEILNTPYEKGPKRLFRDPDNQVLGGVSSGIGHYLNVDATIVRILFVVFAFLWGSSVFLYLLMWIVVPEAKTTAQKLQMNGDAVTIDNIRHSILSEKKKDGSGGKTPGKAGSTLSDILRILLKIAIAVIVVVAIILLFLFLMPFGFGALLLSFLHSVFFDMLPSFPPINDHGMMNSLWQIVLHSSSLLIGLFLVFGIPVIALIRFLIVSAIMEKPLNKSINWVLGIGWLIGVILLIYWTVSYLPMLFSNSVWHIGTNWLPM